jgi:hypothetical protein
MSVPVNVQNFVAKIRLSDKAVIRIKPTHPKGSYTGEFKNMG